MARQCRVLAHSAVPCRLTAGGFQLLVGADAELSGGGVCANRRGSLRVCGAEDADIADKAHRGRVTPPSRRLRDNPSRADNGGLLRLWQMPPESRMPRRESRRTGVRILNIS